MAKKTLSAAEKAKQIAESHNVSVVYANSKGEFFTRKDRALMSVGGDKKKIQKFDFSNAAETEEETDKTTQDDE